MGFHTQAMAQEKSQAGSQQQRMAECSRKAKGLKADAYKRARNDCLQGASTSKVAKKTRSPQQQKMAECSRKAKGLKGEAFKKARNDCLKA